MNHYTLLTSLLYRPWLIMPEAVVRLSPLLENLLNGTAQAPTKFDPQALSYSDDTVVSPYRAKYGAIAKNSIGVVHIEGPMLKNGGECSYGTTDYIRQVKELEANTNVGAILIHIDSPGGQADGIETLAKTIASITKPNASLIDGTGGSAGYWSASAARKVYAAEGTNVVGSIGAMFSFSDVRPYFEKQGVKFHKINATQSPDKNTVFEDALQGKYDRLRAELLDPMAQAFIDGVKANRPSVSKEQLTGHVYTAQNVIGSLIDGVKTFDQVVAELKSEINSSPKITTYYV